jgi:hypothetical protein
VVEDPLVGDRRDDDAGHHEGVAVGVGGAPNARGIAARLDAVRPLLGVVGEVDPPERHAAEEGDDEGRHRDRRPVEVGEQRPGHEDRLAEGDDDQLRDIRSPRSATTTNALRTRRGRRTAPWR